MSNVVRTTTMRNRLNFIGMQAPLGYVPGLGRGATGFTTRSDIGPAREPTDTTDRNASQQAGPSVGRVVNQFDDAHEMRGDGGDDDSEDELNDAYYDEEFGYSHSLVKKDPYEQDDKEADAVYSSVDDRMDERRKERREILLKRQIEAYRKEQPKIQHHFSDLKRKLESVTPDEWSNLPDVGDARSKRQRNPRQERMSAVPDSLIANTVMNSKPMVSLNTQNGEQTELLSMNTENIDMKRIGKARNTLMDMKLNQISDSITGQTVVDPANYLTSLQSLIPSYGGDVSDVKKARKLLKSVRDTNPTHVPAWVASARFEEAAGKIQSARNLILKATEHCSKSEDIWLEATRLASVEMKRGIISVGVQNLPNSVRCWLKAAELEVEIDDKKKVFKKALIAIPNSVKLWKSACELHDEEEARIMLSRAVECCNKSLELWLALAKLETYENAQKVLNSAREYLPSEPLIWITAAKLEESQGNLKRISIIIDRAKKSFEINKIRIVRKDWLTYAINCEKEEISLIETAKAIIITIIDYDLEEIELQSTWLEDANKCIDEKAYECARLIYKNLLEKFPSSKDMWLIVANFERTYGSKEHLNELLVRGVSKCSNFEVLWLMSAKSKWNEGNLKQARHVLSQAFKANPNSEKIWLAAVKLESENGIYDSARKLLTKALVKAPSGRVYMKFGRLEFCLNNIEKSIEIISDGIEKFPDFPKLYLLAAEIYESIGNKDKQKQFLVEGTRACPSCIDIWLNLADLELNEKSVIRARAIIEKGKLLNEKNDELWLKSIQIELKCGEIESKNKPVTAMIRARCLKNAKAIMAKALQDCPKSDLLWSHAIFLETVPQLRKSRSTDAMKQCDNHPLVLLSNARLMWAERNVNFARDWFKRALKVDSDNGDIWAYLYKFELQNGTAESIKLVEEKCVLEEPHHGHYWCKVSKHVKNWKMKTGDILKKVAIDLPLP
ncbi:hypothetical protein SNEBB_006096 [Seison nebaliae]|nr:hypothetical protein SNEBB_006096 [Seison nebaliae]